MGGLVVRRYILQTQGSNESHRLGKVITIASPFLGAAEATYKLYTGGNLEFPFSIFVTPSTYQFLAPHLPSMHQLLPSRKYRELRGAILAEEGDPDGNGVSAEHYEFTRIIQFLNADFPSTSPGTVGATFHDFPGQDDWRNDSSGIKYFHILGLQKELNTTDAIYVSKSIRCRLSGNRLTGCFKNKLYEPYKGPGDKTVPYFSTAMGWDGLPPNSITDLAPPGMRFFRRRSMLPSTDEKAEHTGITQDVKVRDLIAYLLGVEQQPTWSDDLREMLRPSGSGVSALTDTSDHAPSFYLMIGGQIEVGVRDQMGNTAAIENGHLRNDVPGLSTYEMIADDSILLAFSTTDSYAVEFRASITPMGIELIKGVGNKNPTLAIRYNNLDLPVNTRVRLTFSEVGGMELRVDLNNDGTFETVISPTVNLSSTTASDTTPPDVNLNLIAGQGNTAIISLTAIENTSGVNKIWYSLDGQSFDQYVSPFTITLSSNPITIEAFAEDNTANRSGLVSKTVSLSPSVIPIAECLESDNNGFKAWFGYQNQTSSLVSVPVGANNILYPLPGNKGQVTTFQPGLVSRSFGVRMVSKRLDWKLRGIDGLLRTATASLANTPGCQ